MSQWQHMFDGQEELKTLLERQAFDERDLSGWISDKLDERGLAKNTVVRNSRLNQTFAYQIMAGTRNASRDKLIQLAFGMGLDPDEASELLEHGGACALSPHVRRDVIIAFCLHHKMPVVTCDDVLWDFGEPTLSSDCARG